MTCLYNILLSTRKYSKYSYKLITNLNKFNCAIKHSEKYFEEKLFLFLFNNTECKLLIIPNTIKKFEDRQFRP